MHHHSVEFQLIFCVNGWVRVVYEDQGEPMVMHAGDGFLQPPHIRHRVLECSEGMEVVEVTCPADHKTMADDVMTLPTKTLDPERRFSGQRFVFFESAKSSWQTDGDGARTKDTGIAKATNGIVAADIVRPQGELDLSHKSELVFLYVLTGGAQLHTSDDYALARDYAVSIPADTNAQLRGISEDFEMLRVSVPRRTPGQ